MSLYFPLIIVLEAPCFYSSVKKPEFYTLETSEPKAGLQIRLETVNSSKIHLAGENPCKQSILIQHFVASITENFQQKTGLFKLF